MNPVILVTNRTSIFSISSVPIFFLSFTHSYTKNKFYISYYSTVSQYVIFFSTRIILKHLRLPSWILLRKVNRCTQRAWLAKLRRSRFRPFFCLVIIEVLSLSSILLSFFNESQITEDARIRDTYVSIKFEGKK